MGYVSSKSILFNGSTQYATGGNVLNFERTDPFTWSAWIRSTSTSANNSIMSKFGQLSASPGVDFGFGSTGYLFARLSNNVSTNNQISVNTTGGSFIPVNDGEWHLTTLCFDGSSDAAGVFIYVDGVLQSPLYVGANNLTASMLTTADFMIARRAQTFQPQYLAGLVDEAAVYVKALSADEVRWVYNLGNPSNLQHARGPSGLMSWWKMGEDQVGTTIPDQGIGNDLTLVNGPTTVEDAPEGSRYDSSYVNQSESPLYHEYSWTTDFDVDTWKYSSSYVNQSEEIDYREYWYKPTYLSDLAPGAATYYKMRAVDSSQVNPPRYITWIMSGAPDFDGDFYATLGVPTPVGSMVPGSATVVAAWEE